jgi:galactokinase
MEHADVDRLAGWFRDCHGIPPEAVWHAPGRVNFIGEHTDYNGGLVLPFAIGRGVLAAASARPDRLLELRSGQQPGDVIVVGLDALEPGSVRGWAGYVAGAAWALREAGCPVGGTSLCFSSDLPMGAGLASSAALSCAAVSALGQAAPTPPSAAEVAVLARRAETDFVGMPCGIMDQSASMLCEAGHALLLDCGSGESAAVPLDPAAAGLRLLVADTGVRHVLADGQYAVRREQCEEAARLLGASSLSMVGDLAGLSDPVLLRRARHVVSENRRVTQTAALLRAGRLAHCGPLLTASHASLRDDFEVSWPRADAVVSAALAAGALGARMTGGGFGGSVLVLLPADLLAEVTAAIGAALGVPPAAAVLAAVPAAGARQVA